MKIILDSTCDLPDEYIKKYDIEIVPVYVNIGDKVYKDRLELKIEDFYDYLRNNRNNLPKTSGTAPKEFFDRMKQFLTEHTQIFVSTVSSKLSTTFQSAKIAVKKLKSNHISLIDSNSGSGGLGLLGLSAAKMTQKGISDDEILSKIEEMRNKSIIVGYIDDLYNLKCSGRISATKYWVASVLKAKPLLQVKDGLIIPLSKGSGKEKGLKKLVKEVMKKVEKKTKYDLMITHGDDKESAEFIMSKLEKKLSLDEKIVNFLTPALSTHLGLGTIVVSLVPSAF